MGTKKFGAAVLTALMASIPLATTHAGAAGVVLQHATRSAAEVSIGSGIVTAANICSTTSATQTKNAVAVYKATPIAPNAWASRVSGLPFGGAAAYNPAVDGGPALSKGDPDKTPRSDPNAWASRFSGLPFGGAAAYNPAVDGDPAVSKAEPDEALQSAPSAPNAWASRQSSLPFGGAALCV